MRVYCATLYNETNTFSPLLTDESDFVAMDLAKRGSPSYVAAFAPLLRMGGEVVGEFNRAALPGGIITQCSYERLRDTLIRELQSCLPADLVVLNLHGAMVAKGYPDCEGDILHRVRAAVGPHIPISVALDPHSHLTTAMVANANILVAYREYPHTDEAATFAEAVHLGIQAARGEIQPVISVQSCQQISQYPTTRGPMRSLIARLREWEQREGVLAVSVIHGFPWGDVPDLGTKALVVTDRRCPDGPRLAENLATELRAMRGLTENDVVPFEDALARARSGRAPVVVADVADNPGGGAAGDSTFLLRPLLEAGVPAALGPLWDPFAVGLAHKAGTGAQMRLRIGGKVSAASGNPVDLDVTVGVLCDQLRTPGVGGYDVGYGRSACLRAGSVEIILTSEREQAMMPQLFSLMGVDLPSKQIIVVKSAQHFVAGFRQLAGEIVYATSPGTLNPEFSQLPYMKANTSLWPLLRSAS